MLLAVDVGNTQTVLGLFEGERLADSFRLATDRSRTGDELGVTLGALFELEDVDGICLSTTVPALQREWERVAERWAQAPLLTVGPGREDGDPDPLRRSARGRAGPDRERGRGERALRRAVHRRRLRHRDQLRHRLARRGVRRRRARAGDRGLDGRALRACGSARQGRLRRAAVRDRQDDGRGPPVRARLRLRRPGRRDRRAHPGRARRRGADGRHRRPRRPDRPARADARPRSTRTSRSKGCGSSGSGTPRS